MGHVEVIDDAALGGEVVEAWRRHAHAASHRDVVRDRQEQRAGARVGVTRPEQGVDLQGGTLGVEGVDAPAVVHHAFEHRQGPDAHGASMVAVGTDAKLPDDPADAADAAALRRYADALAEAVVAALPGWVERSVAQRYRAWAGHGPDDRLREDARDAGRRAVEDVAPRLRELLATDVDAQRNNPLAILRDAVRHPAEVLSAAGVPPVERDPQAEELFPDDDYDLSPAAFGDLHPSVREPGLVWGAAKAHVILARRRRA